MDTIAEQQQQISSLSANRPAEPPEMEQQQQRTPHGEDLTTAAAAATAWDWGNLLDFTIDDDHSILTWEPPAPAPTPTPPTAQTAADRVRKRDPRLTCENFLAGRVPCSCPEMDEKEEEEGGTGKKRRTTLAALVRCQVPGCEADIRELKGYHRRHRVCLRCANSSTVIMDGEAKRYCQQCGKFHILADFDEGKRSCRRKLERHNNRRRRKSTDCKSVVENEPQANLHADDVFCDGAEKDMCNGVTYAIDGLCLGNQPVDTDTILEPEDGNGSTPCSDPGFQNTQSNGIGITSFASSGETQTNGKDYSKPSLSSSFGGHKTIYSSVCPTGRMSFKLYDWNPAEFPRRLRHQIFQWLASMPVELEGYIRPGCTILTLFIAMPQCMWDKLSEDAFSFVTRLVKAPESLLSGKGPMHIYLNKMIFKTLKDGSLINCNQAERMPNLHYVHPTCFEAGKPMEFVACGNNLFQRKFRLLVSFAGRYLAYDSCISFPQRKTRLHQGVKEDSDQSSDHELFKIHIASTESNLFGPAFIEVENESGLSNFIPVLFVDSQTCSELQVLEQRFSETFGLHGHGEVDPSKSCRLLLSKQTAASELLLDVAWLLREPCLDRSLSSIQIRRFTQLLSFLIEAEAIPVLERILGPLKVFMDAEESYNTSDRTDVTDLRLFQKLMDQARVILHQKLENNLISTMQSENLIQAAILQQRNAESKMLSTLPCTNGVELRTEDVMNQPASTSVSQESDIHAPLINKHVIMNVNQCPPVKKGLEWPRRTCHHLLSSTTGRTRLTLLIMTAVMCFGMCVALGHRHEVGRFAVSVQRYVYSAFNSR